MDKRTNKVIGDFYKRVRNIYPDARIILFGSRARGDNLKNSDFDIIVISEKFKNLKMPRRLEKIYDLWTKIQYNADIIPYTPKELKKEVLF